jgi:hypothetical protein
MKPRYKPGFAGRVVVSLTACAAIGFTSPVVFAAGTVPNPTVTAVPYDTGSKHHPFMSASINLAAMGYVESEYQISGTANIYAENGKWNSDGQWGIKVAQADVPYTTRLLVRRPADPAKFNGTVIVEWLNVTAQIDTDPIWGQAHTELLRDGYAWIGVSAQTAGVKQLKYWDADRYGALDLDDDSLSFDIFSQAAQAVRSQTALVLGGLPLKHLIGGGESQSAFYMVTYVNALQASAAQVYDGILIYSRFNNGAPIAKGAPTTPHVAYIRSDNAIKVMQVETEQDVGMFDFGSAQQADTGFLRTWETAGTSHYDAYGVAVELPQYQRDVPNLANIPMGCKNPTNQLPFHYVLNAAVVAFTQWLDGGEAPPHAPHIQLSFGGKIVRDEYGNAKGGIRLPQMEAPTAVNNYDNKGGRGGAISALACVFLGNTAPFDPATLATLYPTHQSYVSKFTRAAKAALSDGFLLQPDYDEAVANAKIANVPD